MSNLPLKLITFSFYNVSGSNPLHDSYTMDKGLGAGIGDIISHFQNSSCSDGVQEPCIWASPGGARKIDIGKQIFCNRSLNMKNIVAVGFDMDYTLAQYKPETFESLAYDGTVRKLVYDLGYPEEVCLLIVYACVINNVSDIYLGAYM